MSNESTRTSTLLGNLPVEPFSASRMSLYMDNSRAQYWYYRRHRPFSDVNIDTRMSKEIRAAE